jgi:hypothetical protein
MSQAYLETCLKELDKILRKSPKEARAEALLIYQLGFEKAIYDNYPSRFQEPAKREVTPEFFGCFQCGYQAMQFGELEVDYARERILAEIEKRKAKLSRKSFWDIFRFLRR